MFPDVINNSEIMLQGVFRMTCVAQRLLFLFFHHDLTPMAAALLYYITTYTLYTCINYFNTLFKTSTRYTSIPHDALYAVAQARYIDPEKPFDTQGEKNRRRRPRIL